VCTWCKNGCNELKTPVLQVSFVIYFLIPLRIQRRLKGILSHVNGNRRKPAQGVFERQPWKQDIMKFHWDQILKPDAENEFKVRTPSLAPATFLTCPWKRGLKIITTGYYIRQSFCLNTMLLPIPPRQTNFITKNPLLFHNKEATIECYGHTSNERVSEYSIIMLFWNRPKL